MARRYGLRTFDGLCDSAACRGRASLELTDDGAGWPSVVSKHCLKHAKSALREAENQAEKEE